MTPVITSPADDAVDTEITLGTGKMLGLFFGLVILCAIFFGMGFTMGKNSVRSAPELLPSPSTTSARNSAANRRASAPAAAEVQASEQAQASPAASPENAANPSTPSSSPDQAAAPAIPTQAGQAYYVQVAAVSKQEDADALVDSLKGRQYFAFVANQPSDKLFHVQVGPFTDIKLAEDMRAKLVGDGYSPILKK